MRVPGLVLSLVLLMGVSDLRGQRAASEYALKGAFIYNVASFVEWPPDAFASATEPLRIAVVSPQPIPEFEAALTNKSIRGHAVRVQTYASADQLTPSHVVFVSDAGSAQMRGVLKYCDQKPVLTVTEQDPELPSTAVVSLGVAQARLAFSVNLDVADAAHLKMSPNLLKLARNVQSSRARAK